MWRPALASQGHLTLLSQPGRAPGFSGAADPTHPPFLVLGKPELLRLHWEISAGEAKAKSNPPQKTKK